jgi:hypothetical protein
VRPERPLPVVSIFETRIFELLEVLRAIENDFASFKQLSPPITQNSLKHFGCFIVKTCHNINLSIWSSFVCRDEQTTTCVTIVSETQFSPAKCFIVTSAPSPSRSERSLQPERLSTLTATM